MRSFAMKSLRNRARGPFVLAMLIASIPIAVAGLGSADPAAAVEAASTAPPCVSILTPTIGAFEAGNTVTLGEVAAAPGLVSGAVLGPLAQVPGIDEVGSSITKAFPTIDGIANQLSAQGGSGLSTFGRSIAPLNAANPALDALVALGSNGLNAAASMGGSSIAPFNGTLAQLAQTIGFFSSSTCTQ
jgi:hypothetical protein